MKYVFEIAIKDGHTAQEYIDAWKAGSALIQAQAGAQGTTLHRKLGEPHTLLAIATWMSKAARDAAMARLDQAPPDVRRAVHRHRDLADIRILGHFEEIERVDPGP